MEGILTVRQKIKKNAFKNGGAIEYQKASGVNLELRSPDAGNILGLKPLKIPEADKNFAFGSKMCLTKHDPGCKAYQTL